MRKMDDISRLSFYGPEPLIDAIHAAAASQMCSATAWMRAAAAEKLAAQGRWPSQREAA
jgi:hypothetical protein